MSQSDEEDDFAFFGTPLEQYDEETIPRKKPLTVQDQIATDEHGRRRFHGAFTGGFSAGFYNTVGSLEGWTPSSFVSTRNKKADTKFQRPEDFMDDEDHEEYGIAPKVLRAKPEYGGLKTQKRERVQFSEAPIPGEPVLKSILEPVRETVGVLLLMKMGWKPGQGIGPRLTRLQKKKEKARNKIKIYKCSLPGQSDSESEDGDEDIDESIVDPNVLFAPEEHEIHFLNPKLDSFGMGYSGLEKKSILSQNLKSNDTFKLFDNNKKLAIKGQAFGVGAFEEDDDDIYAREDMSQYDFALETSNSLKDKRNKQKQANKLLAITGSSGVLEGFVPASKSPPVKKIFPPPVLPPNFQPVHNQKKSRFDLPSLNIQEIKSYKKEFITAESRAAILEGSRPKNFTTDEKIEEEIDEEKYKDNLGSFRPFIADPEKQNRYERYLHFIKIGAKDAFPSIQPTSMNEWEKERERNEFEQAARLYKPLSGMMAERFSHGELPDDSTDPLSAVPRFMDVENSDMREAVKSKMYGKLTRRITDWAPSSLLCKRMNIAEPLDRGGLSICQVVNKKRDRPKFSVFNFLEVQEKNSLDCKEGDEIKSDLNKEKLEENNKLEITNQQSNSIEELPKSVNEVDFEEPLEKKDLFKAIFCSDDDEDPAVKEEEEEINKIIEQKKNVENKEKNKDLINEQQQPITLANALRNTSPPRGIFANLDLDALNKRKTTNTITEQITTTSSLLTKTTKSSTPPPPPPPKSESHNELNDDKVDETFLYGPSLPTKPVFTPKSKDIISVKIGCSSDSSSDDEWVEREEELVKKKHHHKRHSKKKKDKKKNKSKSKKKDKKK